MSIKSNGSRVAKQQSGSRGPRQKRSSGKAKVRRRRTRDELNAICDALYAIIESDPPMTCRQTFYQAVSRGIIEKSESAYKNTVCRLLAKMRREERMPYHWIADNTRWQRKPAVHDCIEDALWRAAEYYRRDLWSNQDGYVEIWCEKDALAGVLYPETSKWHVPLMVSKGFASISYLYEAAQAIINAEKPAFLYYFGDHDPSGVHIDRAIERQLRELAPDADITFQRKAVTVDQINEYSLQTRPTKETDSRAKSFRGESVELDALPPAVLRCMVTECIEQHIDGDALAKLQQVEYLERETLQRFVGLDQIGLADVAEGAGL